MMLKPFAIMGALAAAAVLSGAPARAGSWGANDSNDTGGILPWAQPRPDYAAIAAAQCAAYNKVAIVTSLPRKYGDDGGYICAFPPGYDPVKAGATLIFGR